MEELDYDYRVHEDRRKGDEKLYVRFYTDILPDPEASAKEGIRKFREAEMVQIMVPGDKRNVRVLEVRDVERDRFPEQYKRFKAGQAEVVNGYPLAQWPLATRSMVEELKYLGFQTVEQVAGAGDNQIGKHPGLRELKRRAESWLIAQKEAAPIEKMNAELAKRDEMIAALQAQLDSFAKGQTQMKKAA